jgi:hypothetical protein
MVAAAVALLLTACATPQSEQESGALSGTALVTSESTPAPAPSCDRLRPRTTGVAYEPATPNLGSGDITVCDLAGGWSMVVPQAWFERPSQQHGREIMSYDPARTESSGGVPGREQILVRLQMVQNPTGLAPAAFAATPFGGIWEKVRDQKQVTIAGQPAELYEVGNIPPSSPDQPETTLFWYLRSPFFADRMVRVSLARPDAALRAEGERIVASLRFFQPTPINFVPTVSRAAAIARVTSRAELVLTRIEAKLVLRKELEATKQFGTEWWSDPDALAWVVVYVGTGIHQQNFGPGFRLNGTPAPPPPCLSGLVIFPADGESGSQIGPGCNPGSSWPTWFDSLIDHGN